MTPHQVLARKWRPRSFHEVVGQTPTVQALVNSLEQNRLHHAYLFTGTRGVGKTSIARLFAKCLNCEQGITSSPCDTCQPCQAIDRGQFLDLIEVDAASRTKVEDTRELLDNAQYSPSLGRYKIYLIDEVHMLSNHSFNALLKTLEEPPEHVKFLLATTDPQKLPVTVLSRCLQFHLKNLSAHQIIQQLTHILTEEHIPHEPSALNYLAQAAQGSMRDALSLLDQAIGYGNGTVKVEYTRDMLGATAPQLLLHLVSALIDQNATQMLETIHDIAATNVDFEHALEDLLSLLHQLALLHAVPTLSDEPLPFGEEARQLLPRITAQDIQLYYQIALIGRRDLPLAPTPRSGFEMILLRMLAFYPEPSLLEVSPRTTSTQSISEHTTKLAHSSIQQANTVVTPKKLSTQAMTQEDEESWAELVTKLDLHGMALIVASHCACLKKTDSEIVLALDKHHADMLNKTIEQRITEALKLYLKKTITLSITIGKSSEETPIETKQRKLVQAHSEAIDSIAQDTHLNALLDAFDANVLPSLTKPKRY